MDESFYPEIIDNERQIEEWKKLFAIDEIEGYVEPLTIKFLKEKSLFGIRYGFLR